LAAAVTAAVLVPVLAFAVCWCLFPFPLEKLNCPGRSILVTDRSGRTLLELAGHDGQRRRPVPLSEMSPWLSKAVLAIEDERFESHCGVDLCAVGRAVGQNLWARRTVSGASTISMQLCKMIDERPRTWRAKLVEAFRALQLERRKSKPEILADYLNLIPCGGNLRGVEVASQAYFGKSALQLSLGEAALLAGLPQSPNRYAPDRHPDAACRRREMVLKRMLELEQISPSQYDEALREPLLVRSRSVGPPAASHAAWMAIAERPTGGRTTIDLDRQRDVEALVRDHAAALPEGADAAVVVLDVVRGEIVALVGSANECDPRDGQVNGVTARRSPGSTLKPFLYAAAFETRRLAPDSPVDDIPIERAGWTPANFDRTYRGSITAAEALRQSLNVPAITLTEGLGLPRCLGVLESVGLKLPPDAEARGGLAVATGGLEVTLLDLTNAYATLAREGVHREPRLFCDTPESPQRLERREGPASSGDSVRVLDANVCRAVSAILSSEQRSPRGWEFRPGVHQPWFAWKTGTSSGRRDAWAVGHNGRFAIGVWVGFFHGAGHHEFVGRDAAEPLLASLFASASFRVEARSPAYESWRVEQPLPRPVEAGGGLAILSPRGDSVFLAWNGTTVIHPSVTGGEPITWFHNGRVLSANESSRLIVPRGAHELRAVAASGESAAVRFTVK
jgi:penicillin-binding protein 1C